MENEYSFEDVRHYEFLEEDYICTCDQCIENQTCTYAYDPYNSNGDCLADK